MPEKVTLHYKDGSTVQQDAIDARRTLVEHPSEYSTKPFPAAVQEAAKVEAAEYKDKVVAIQLSGDAPHRIEASLNALSEQQQAAKKAADDAVRSGNPHPLTAEKPKSQATTNFEAKHRGRGSYSVTDVAGKEVLEGLSKEDAEAFNALSDEEKAEYVAAETAAKS